MLYYKDKNKKVLKTLKKFFKYIKYTIIIFKHFFYNLTKF